MKLRGLYAITPEGGDFTELERKVHAALEGGAVALQYRAKALDRAGRARQARVLHRACRAHGAPLIVNDDLELALEIDAEGVHLGRDDGDIARARTRLGSKLIGASCYNELAAAHRAVAAGADYVAFGAVYPSPTKPQAVRAPLPLLGAQLPVPVCAIGGITVENAPALLAAGAAMLAVLSDLFEAPDVRERARQYGRLFA